MTTPLLILIISAFEMVSEADGFHTTLRRRGNASLCRPGGGRELEHRV